MKQFIKAAKPMFSDTNVLYQSQGSPTTSHRVTTYDTKFAGKPVAKVSVYSMFTELPTEQVHLYLDEKSLDSFIEQLCATYHKLCDSIRDYKKEKSNEKKN